MTTVEEYLNKANDEYKKGEDYKKLADKCFNNYAELIAIYRIESVNRVLDFIRSECCGSEGSRQVRKNGLWKKNANLI